MEKKRRFQPGGEVPESVRRMAEENQMRVWSNDKPLVDIHPESFLINLGLGIGGAAKGASLMSTMWKKATPEQKRKFFIRHGMLGTASTISDIIGNEVEEEIGKDRLEAEDKTKSKAKPSKPVIPEDKSIIGDIAMPEVPGLNETVAFKFIKNLENPRDKGLKNGRFHPYKDGSTAVGYGTDLNTNAVGKKIRERAFREGIPYEEAKKIALDELKMHDKVIMDNLINEGYTNRPDTISHGVRLLGAQARYQLGNIIPFFKEWAGAVIEGDAEKQKKIINKHVKGKDRKNKIATFDPYYYKGGWHSEKERQGIK